MLKIRVVKAMLRVTAAAAISLLVTFSALAQTIRYIHTDGLGSVVLITDKDRNIVERSEYEPYGGLLNRPITDGPGYTGQVTDAVTGLSYMQQRYYDPQVGLFLSVDPVSTYSTPTGAFNRYRYANNNTYKFTDPDGRQSQVPSTGVPVWDWLTASSDAQGSSGQMMEKQLAFELSQPHSAEDVVLYTAIAMSVGTGAAAGVGRLALPESSIADSALVVRGGSATGANSAEGLAKGINYHPDGVWGFSADSANGASLCELCTYIRHNQVGVTTAGEIRAAGGEVINTGGILSPNHATVMRLSGQDAASLLKVQKNPVPPSERKVK